MNGNKRQRRDPNLETFERRLSARPTATRALRTAAKRAGIESQGSARPAGSRGSLHTIIIRAKRVPTAAERKRIASAYAAAVLREATKGLGG